MRAFPIGFLVIFSGSLPSLAWAGGQVKVSSMVEGARILVDEVDQGVTTPALLPDVAPGLHMVTVISGCQRGDEKVMVAEGSAEELFIEMAPVNGMILVNAVPAEAHVSIDGMPATGASDEPVQVNCGSHAISAQYSGFQPTFINLDVGPGEQVVLPIRLEALGFGRLVVQVAPTDSSVFIDGNQLSVGAIDTTTVVEGPHVLDVKHEGFAPEERQFVLQADNEARFDIALTPLDDYKAPREQGSKKRIKGTTVAGIALGIGGLASGGYALTELRRTSNAHAEYAQLMDEANLKQNPALAGAADDYYVSNVQPHLVNTWAAGIAAGVLLAGGATLIIAF